MADGNKSKKKNVKIAELPKNLEHLNINAAGIDIGSTSHFVAVPQGRDVESVREFTSFTEDLKNISDWLKKCNVDTVAMESTGVYWIPLYDFLEKEGFKVFLVDARHVKNVCGRKTDVQDCQWIQQLHTYGLLSGAFRPPEMVCALRTVMRQRDMLIRYLSSHVLHMQKSLNLMNIKLHNVISDITGITGMSIIRAIVNGERDPKKLAEFRDGRCKSSVEVIEKSLEGSYSEEHLFSLKIALELYDTYNMKKNDCDKMLEYLLKKFDNSEISNETNFSDNDRNDGNDGNKSNKKTKRFLKNEPKFDLTDLLKQKSGIDLTKIPGISATTALVVLSEIGFSVDAWDSEKKFSSWLGLCPNTKISGGKPLSTKTKICANRVAASLRLAATNIGRTQTSLGAFHRRMVGKLGKPQAITAVAHKLCRLIYSMLKNGTEYVEKGVEACEKAYNDRALKRMQKQAQLLGYELVEKTSS